MKMVLVACEESQRVTIALRELGYEAFSCDIVDPSGGHPEWHIKEDVTHLLDGRCIFETMDGTVYGVPEKWSAIIAFPTCTFLTVTANKYYNEEVYGDERYGLLTVIEYSRNKRKPCGATAKYYKCKCDCGEITEVLGSNLKSGNTKSCGCLSKKIRKERELPDNDAEINHIILQYKRHARERSISWNLTFDQVKEMINKPCYYCGKSKANVLKTKNCKDGFAYNGIDRIDSSLPYDYSNVISCCSQCNRMKNNRDPVEFLKWANDISKRKEEIIAIAVAVDKALDDPN